MQQLVSCSPRGKDVQPIDQYPIYELGAALQQLKDAAFAATKRFESGGEEDPDHITALWLADYQLRALLDGKPFSVSFSRASAETLSGHVTALMHQINAHANATTPAGSPAIGPPPVETWRWYSIRTGLDKFEHQFSAELKKLSAYAVPDRGIFKTEGLVDAADNHIHESIRGWVPEFARAEFRAAGKCFAFGLYSASGFHSARAVECLLREYHKEFCPTQDASSWTMGQMAGALEDMHKATQKAARLPKQNTVRHLKDFANFDRNPLMHKTTELEEIDAATFFSAAAAVLVEMAREMKEWDDTVDGMTPVEAPKRINQFSANPAIQDASEEDETASQPS